MEVTCFGLDWTEVRKRPDAQAVVEEMIESEDLDRFAQDLPDGMWRSESAAGHFEAAEALADLIDAVDPNQRGALETLTQLLSTGDSIDELGLGPLTEGCYFVSLSPERVAELHQAFASLDRAQLAKLHEASRPESTADFRDWLEQWGSALSFALERGLGLIGHCG